MKCNLNEHTHTHLVDVDVIILLHCLHYAACNWPQGNPGQKVVGRRLKLVIC